MVELFRIIPRNDDFIIWNQQDDFNKIARNKKERIKTSTDRNEVREKFSTKPEHMHLSDVEGNLYCYFAMEFHANKINEREKHFQI